MSATENIRRTYQNHVELHFGESPDLAFLPHFLAHEDETEVVIASNCAVESMICRLIKALEVYAHQTGKTIRLARAFDLALAA